MNKNLFILLGIAISSYFVYTQVKAIRARRSIQPEITGQHLHKHDHGNCSCH